MKIKLLSEFTINRIAAGEVVERPASVIKELVENAIDAGASKIDVIIEQAGKNLIIVADDGIGMSAEELAIAVERHTTSKLDEDDLFNITTLGFRGEALPSIASVSKILIASRAQGSAHAHQLELHAGHKKQIKLASHEAGTRVEIRDLFFNIPARLKFLRSDKTELNSIIDLVKKIALTHPSIAFSLSTPERSLIKTTKRISADHKDALKQRIAEILGSNFTDNSIGFEAHYPPVEIIAYAGLPTFTRATAEDQFLFINNRPIKDKALSIALKVAYQDYIARERYPAAIIYLKIDPHLVDVNVHPAKSEVRFHDPILIQQLLIKVLKEALAQNSQKVSSTIADSALGFFGLPQAPPPPDKTLSSSNALPSYFSDIQSPSLASSKNNMNKSFQIAEDNKEYKQLRTQLVEPATTPTSHTTENEQDYCHNPLGMAKAQLHQTYIISQTKESIIIIDQHAAHERLTYQKIKQELKESSLIKQRLLIPRIVELPDSKRAEALYSKKEEMAKLGLTIEKFGEQSIIALEAPSIISTVNIEQLIHDLADNLLECDENN